MAQKMRHQKPKLQRAAKNKPPDHHHDIERRGHGGLAFFVVPWLLPRLGPRCVQLRPFPAKADQSAA